MNKIIYLGVIAALTIGAPLALQPSYAEADQQITAQCMEDQPCWSCVDDGNRVCGPGNANHVPAGCYDDGGVLVEGWPCKPWKPSDGWRHGDGSVTYPSCEQDNDCLEDDAFKATGPNAYDDGAYVGGWN